jgi:hypothetical protein
MNLHTKTGIAQARKVTPRTVDNWVRRRWLSPPLKLGAAQQSRVRWTDEQVAELDRRLADMRGPRT